MFGISKYIIAGLLLLMGSMVLVGRWYYYDTQETIKVLNENNATLKANQTQLQETINTNNETILRQQVEAKQIAEANDQLKSQLVNAEKYADDLAGKLRRHNLTVLTMQKPGLIESRVNNATEKLFREMEAITGSNPLNE
jgi:predicted nuclease with TOPRIM domain